MIYIFFWNILKIVVCEVELGELLKKSRAIAKKSRAIAPLCVQIYFFTIAFDHTVAVRLLGHWGLGCPNWAKNVFIFYGWAKAVRRRQPVQAHPPLIFPP